MKTFNLFGDIVANDSQRLYDSDVTPTVFVGWLAKQDGDIEISINSNGGSVTGGLAIANAIKGYSRGKVTANVLGIAASMASVVACACDEIKMGEGSFLMIHNPWTVTMGDADDLRHEADVLDEIKAAIVGFYRAKCSKSHEELAELMDAEVWIVAEKAAEFGFSVGAYTETFAAAASLTRRLFAGVPDAARAFVALGEKQAAAPAAEPVDWEARYKGAMTALNKIREKSLAEIKDLHDQLVARDADLTAARAELSSVVARAETAERDLAQEREQHETLKNAHAALTGGGILSPADEILPTLAEGLAKCATPAERSAFIASGKFRKN